MKKPVDKEKLERYRVELPRGGQKDAAKLAGVTPKSVNYYLNGVHDSERIEFAILEVIRRHKLKLELSKKAAGL